MTKTIEELQELSFQIILYAGNARSYAMEAIQFAKENKFDEADQKIAEAESEFNEAHQVQTNLLQDEANGKKNDLSIILIHAQDHLMTSMTVKDLAVELISVYQKIKENK